MSSEDTINYRGPIHLNCPHCHNPIELVVDSPKEEVVCPSCGSSFNLDPERTEPFPPFKLPQLGKFELIDVVGRGGFGTVYRARDTALQRIVAVKVPRSGQLTTREDEDRFVREARNAAQLQHAGIVPVYEVGRSDTVPYIVSEFVEGNTLADALIAGRFSFRDAAQLIAQIAAALEHAHTQGVVHRDLKPSNIMLTADGDPRVMDFGLAKRDAGEITMTIEGQVLGTPAYMSPEQASGQAHNVDGRSDVYSLGVILFELLTGELPFRGNQRMLLQQVMHDEPRGPRSLNDRIPRDLETVCLKAMAKEPSRRYQSAQAVADDLARYRTGIPITARPVGRVERSWRWCRRNPVVAGLSAAVLLALMSGTGISTYFGIKADTRAHEAEASFAEATRQRERAEAGFHEARQAVDKYYTSVSESKLLNVPGLQPLRKELLESALEYYQKFIGEHGDDQRVQAELAAAYGRVGKITHSIGSAEQSLVAYQRAIEILVKMVREHPTVKDYRSSLARSYSDLGGVQYNTGHLGDFVVSKTYKLLLNSQGPAASQFEMVRLGEAEASWKNAIEINEKLVQEDPAVNDYRYSLAGNYVDLGEIHKSRGRNDEAAASIQRALEIGKDLVRQNPAVERYQYQLAGSYSSLSYAQIQAGRNNEAEVLARKAIEIQEKLVHENPSVSAYQDALAGCYGDLGSIQSIRGRMDDAKVFGQKAIDVYETLVRENPSVSDYQGSLSTAYGLLANAQCLTGRQAEAEASITKAIEIAGNLLRKNPTVPSNRTGLANALEGYGGMLAMSQRWKDSVDAYTQAVELSDHDSHAMSSLAMMQLAVGDENGYRATCADLLARHGAEAISFASINIALACVVGEHAVDDMDRVVILAKRVVASIPLDPFCITVLGAAQFRAGRTEEAVATLKQTMPLYAVASLAAPSMMDGIRTGRLFSEVFLALCYRDLGNGDGLQQQLDNVRALIDTLEAPRQRIPNRFFKPWAIPFGVALAKRELVKLSAEASANSQ